jgi:hypothetical protein
MNPGAAEEAGKAIGGIVDALKSQPLSLALVMMNLALLAYVFYRENHVATSRQETTRMILDYQKEVGQLLSRCVVPGTGLLTPQTPQQQFKLQSEKSVPFRFPDPAPKEEPKDMIDPNDPT